ncbi:MAG: hypothetical protein U9R08_00885 [Nanoarchaeota archaeon]|nr:hypothetical protein [Nanoarchaeota archaeon]
MNLESKFKHVKKVILDAGGCILKVDKIEYSDEAVIQNISAKYISRDSDIERLVRVLFREVKNFANRIPGVTYDKIITSIYEGVNWYFSKTHNVEKIKKRVRRAIFRKSKSRLPDKHIYIAEAKKLKHVYEGDKGLQAYEFTKQFLEHLNRSSLDYAILTDAPHSAQDIRHALMKYGVPPERVIPSQEIGTLKSESDLPYIAAMLLLYKGWDAYQSLILERLDEIQDRIGLLRGMRDLSKIVNVLGLDGQKLKQDFASTAGFFDSPEEHWRAYSLGLRSFHVQRQAYIHHGFFTVPDLSQAIPRLGQLEERLEKNPEANNYDIQND